MEKCPHLEVYDHPKDKDCGKKVHKVGQVLPVEGFPQTPHLVLPGGQEVEEGDDCTLKLCACSGGIGGWSGSVDGVGGRLMMMMMEVVELKRKNWMVY